MLRTCGLRRVVRASVVLCLGSLAVGGCASEYVPPGRAVNLNSLAEMNKELQTDGPVVKEIEKKPLATLPTSIAVARVQAPGYQSETAQGYGTGAYSVVTTRDIENMDATMEAIGKLKQVRAITPVSRMLLPPELHSDLDLRKAAAALHSDMLLIYTLDTTFVVDDGAAPLTVLTLGLSPNQVAHVVCTASAVLMDTRDGYVYTAAEATERKDQLASAWTSKAAVDGTRRKTESAAFAKLVTELETAWPHVVEGLSSEAGQAFR